MPQHSIPHIVSFVLAIVLHCLAYALYMVSINKSGERINLVKQNVSASFHLLYATEMAPALWGEIIWQIIYPTQFWWIFNFSLCKVGPDGEYFYKHISFLIHLFYGLGIGLQIPRFVLLGHDYNLASFFASLLSTILLVAACVVRAWKPAIAANGHKVESVCNNDDSCQENKGTCEKECKKECKQKGYFIWSCAVFNAMATVAVWSSFYTLVTLALVLTHASPLQASPQDSATGCLCVFLILIVVHIGLDLAVFDNYCRYEFCSYVYQILAMACVLSQRYEAGSRNTTLTIVILVLASVSLIAKVVNCCVREYLAHQQRKQRGGVTSTEKTNPAYTHF